MKSKSYLKISRTWSFNAKVSKVFDNHVRQSIPLYDEFHKQISQIAEFYCKDNSLIYNGRNNEKININIIFILTTFI